MKNILKSTTVLAIAGILAAGYWLGGCQSTSTAGGGSVSQKETLLAQAGFKTKTVTTPDQQKLVLLLPPQCLRKSNERKPGTFVVPV